MRVLVIGDGVSTTTGFAQILRRVAAALVGAGHEVGQIAALDTGPFVDSRPYHDLGVTPFFPGDDHVGFSIAPDVLDTFAPDRILLNMDPGMAWSWLGVLRGHRPETPVVLYAPLEGGPPCQAFVDAFATADETILYTDWAATEVERVTGRRFPWVWHGVDTQTFHPLRYEERQRVRRALGWEDRFVVAYVARNCARKAHDRLIEAFAILQDALPQALLYLHCQPFEQFWMQGWDLAQVARQYGVEVEFPSTGSGVRGEPPVAFARKLACADLYCHPAQVEGFGLPILEAMAAGLPVVITKDGGNMQEVAGDAALGVVPPAAWLTWFTSARLAVTLPEQWAQAILTAHANPEARRAAVTRGLARAETCSWQPMLDQILAALDRAGADTPAEVAAG